MAFLLSLFAAVTVQKNVRDISQCASAESESMPGNATDN